MTIMAIILNAARKLVLRIARLISEGAIMLAIELDEPYRAIAFALLPSSTISPMSAELADVKAPQDMPSKSIVQIALCAAYFLDVYILDCQFL